MLIFALIMTLLLSYQLLWDLKINKYFKFLLTLLIAAAAFKFQLIHLFGGKMFFAPDLPGWILLTAGWLYGVVFFSFFFLLIPAAAALFLKIYCRKKKLQLPDNFHKTHLRGNLAMLSLAVFASTAAFYNARRPPEVRQVEIVCPDLPESAENYKITVLADLHIDRTWTPERTGKIVERANNLQSGTIILLGDIVDGRVSRIGKTVRGLEKLQAKDGVYGIMGNHEYFSGGKEWAEFFTQCRIKMLMNENIKHEKGFFLAGITDPAAKHIKPVSPLPDLGKALQGIKADDCAILLAHRPGHALEAAEKAVDLQLSGHTHGGMIRGFDLLVGRFNENFISGMYKVKDMVLYVSNGTAIWSGFPLRLGRDSEITVITLKKYSKQGKEK